jgi:hypothetical protein
MIVRYTYSRTSIARLVLRGVAIGAALAGPMLACGSSDLVVGDDSRDDSRDAAPETTSPEAALPDANAKDSSTGDARSDGPPVACSAAPGGPGMCLPPGTACRQADTTFTCPTAGSFCCTTACPELAQPPPGFCDGGGFAPLYDSKACIVGFACTPVTCTAAGGTCVGLAPGSCKNNNFGDATKYSCGGGIGSGCCLPSP